MLGSIYKYLRIKLGKQTDYQIFTYFIPGPPQRKSGYREKEIDCLFEQLQKAGFAITNITTQALNSSDQPGLWVIAKLFPLTKEAKKLAVQDFPQDSSSASQVKTEDQTSAVEGIYYID